MSRCVFAFVLLLGACGKNNEPPPPSSGSPTAKPESGPSHKKPHSGTTDPNEQARRIYGTLCTQCHGADGTGNTPVGEQLNPHPRNYTDPAWQKSVTDDELRKAIVGGGVAVGKSNSMPPNPDLADKPDVVNGLVAIIRGFGQK